MRRNTILLSEFRWSMDENNDSMCLSYIDAAAYINQDADADADADTTAHQHAATDIYACSNRYAPANVDPASYIDR